MEADKPGSMQAKPIRNSSVRKVTLSLRTKMMILLTSIPLVVLALYFTFAMNEFQNDKEAYVFDSSVAVAKSLGTQIRVEMESYLSSIKPIVESYDAVSGTVNQQGRELFSQFSKLNAIIIYRGDLKGQYFKMAELVNGKPLKLMAESLELAKIRQKSSENGFYLTTHPLAEGHLVIASRIGKAKDPTHLVIVGLYKSETLVSTFQGSKIYRNFLIDESARIAIGPTSLKGSSLDGEKFEKLFKPVVDGQLPESSFGLSSSRGKKLLVSYASAGIGNLKVVSVVDRQEAMKTVDVLIFKSILIYLALVFFTALISAFASMTLTSKLRELYDATRKIASGKFDVRIRTDSQDEIGGLADGFNVMAAEVSRLMSETAEKARMENELATVKTVQETLFPPSEGDFERVRVAGHFEPASECGGDWWSYNIIDGHVYLWIGDATGHGAPAALITSAARSAAAIIEGLPNMSPGKGLEVMNRAIHETSKSKINMTFFLAMIDMATGIMTYSNASHDPPYLIRKVDGRKISKKNLEPLVDVNGLRLGEKLNSTYDEAKVQLSPGDSLVFYTDGIIDLQDPTGAKWGERTFIKNIIEATNGSTDLSSRMAFLKRNIVQFRGNAQLLDDVTIFMAEFKESA